SVAGGTAAGFYQGGRIAAVEHTFGKGRTLLIGTFPGGGYYLRHSADGRRFFASLLDWAKVTPRVRLEAAGLQAPLREGAGGKYLWVVNPERPPRTALVSLPVAAVRGEDLWGSRKVSVSGRTVQVEVGDRDVAVIRLE